MAGSVFIDTNVLVYAHDHDSPAKRSRAIELLRDLDPSDVVISGQVLGEFYVVVTRRLHQVLSTHEAQSAVEALSAFTCVPIDSTLVVRAVARSRRSQLSYWDGLIVEAALEGGCSTLLTEDLGAGSRFEGLAVVNPFA